MSALVVYTRPGCHLCDQAMAQLRPLAAELGLAYAEVDIEGDDALHARYLERIPVFVLDGEEIGDYFLPEAALRARA